MYEYLDRRYALALYEIAEKKGKEESIIDEMQQVITIIRESNHLQELIRHPQLSTNQKKGIFTDIFDKKISEELLSFILLLIEKGRITHLEEILNEIRKIHLERKDTLVAYVKTVISLDDKEKNDLKDALQKKYNKKILLNEEIDKSIIGGVFVRVGNDVIDGTIKSKFEEIRRLTIQ